MRASDEAATTTCGDGFHSGCQCGYQSSYDLATVRLFEKDQISHSDQYGYTANIRRGLNPKTHFLRLAGIGGRVVLADHPEQDTVDSRL